MDEYTENTNNTNSLDYSFDDYLNKNLDHHKFLIVKSFSKKTYSQVVKDYKNAEIFTIYEFLEDILAYTVSKDEAQSKLQNFLRS